MMPWIVGASANLVISIAYFAIVWAIVSPLIRSGQVRSNPLGAATAAIFFTCAVHHGSHAVHMFMPAVGLDEVGGQMMRDAWTWQLAAWDVIGAAVGLYYWTLRRNYGSLMQGAQLFEDMRRRESQALELNDNVLQGLVVAKMSLDMGETERAKQAMDTAIESASAMITQLLGREGQDIAPSLRRSAAALEKMTGADGASRGRGHRHDAEG